MRSTFNLKDASKMIEVSKALSSPTRLAILNLLSDRIMSVSDIAEELALNLATATVNINKLEKAGLIQTQYAPGIRGAQKLCSRVYDDVLFQLPGLEVHPDSDHVEMSIPVGNYRRIEPVPTCGLVSESGILGLLDHPPSFQDPNHVFAQLLWTSRGWVEYEIPNNLPNGSQLVRLAVTMEICSEAPNFRLDFPSDITLWVENSEVGTWTCPGDFGGERGKLTPGWWLTRYTQYGLLKSWVVTKDGSYLDGIKLSDMTVDNLGIGEQKSITLRIGNKEDAKNPRGFNLFGRSFGNYPQDIILRMEYRFPNERRDV